ncbi:M20/M25/M40 family metallo-hydrolase [Aquilutibacter rugosus]
MRISTTLAALTIGLTLATTGNAQPMDLNVVSRIRQEAFYNSQVMQTFTHLTEEIGPRLTNSPNMQKANDYAKSKFNEWGLSNVKDVPFEDFGRGWDFRSAHVEMIAPRAFPLHALPKAWTPGTNGPIEGEAMAVTLKSAEDFKKYQGKLKGKILFLSELRAYKPGTEPDQRRYDDAGLAALQSFAVPKTMTSDRAKRIKDFRDREKFTRELNKFLVDEGVLATVSISGWDNGIIRVGGAGSRRAGESVGVPDLAMIAEHYNQVMRMLDHKDVVRIRADIEARFTSDSNDPGYNTLAELPGTSKADEIVMLGAHMDSWHTGTGANDNAAGTAVMMEAMRILKSIGVKPKRTIRVALWGGEEQGLIGSADYVSKTFASYPLSTKPEDADLPKSLRPRTGAMQRKPAYDKFSVYFNMDNGSGKFRGIYAQENLAAMPIFQEWLKPFNDLGATTVVSRNTGSTDHISFDRVGLPGFQFVQDGLDYFTNVHHSHLDTVDHASEEDLKHNAAMVAAFVYAAAMRDERMPRKAVIEE